MTNKPGLEIEGIRDVVELPDHTFRTLLTGNGEQYVDKLSFDELLSAYEQIKRERDLLARACWDRQSLGVFELVTALSIAKRIVETNQSGEK